MKTDQRAKFRAKHTKDVCSAIFNYTAPESVFEFPWLHIRRGSGMKGSGESTQFTSTVIATLDGKRLKRQESMFRHDLNTSPEYYLPHKNCFLIFKSNNSALYAVIEE